MRRFAVACVVIAIAAPAATGAWALPASEPDPEPVSLPGPSPVEREVTPSVAPVEVAEPVAAVADPPPPPVRPLEPITETADHLAVPEQTAVQPVVVDTTTTTTTTPPKPKVTVAFTAAQAYGSCGEDVPYDVFSGTATPGTTVTISSSYGGGTVTADGSGHWERKVEFPDAPRDQTFAVTLSGLGGSKTVHFTATGGPEHA